MKKILTYISALACSFTLMGQGNYPCPTNGNAENNSFLNWATYTGSATDPQYIDNFSSIFDPFRFGVHDANTNYGIPGNEMIINGIDEYGGFEIPSEGNYCFRVGNNATGAQAEAMRYTFTVTNENKIFKLRYALVLQDPQHTSGHQPSAWFYFVKGATMTPSFASFPLFTSTIQRFTADMNNPFYKISSTQSDVVYRSWECIEFDLSQYVGETLSFVALVRDCTEGGHFGYMYLDGLCTEWPATAVSSLNGTDFCLEETILLDGSLSEGEDSYFVEVLEVDANNAPVNNGLEINDWFVAQQAPPNFNVTDYIASKGEKLECGKRYKIKLAVANRCAQWNETNKFINIVCPEVDAGDDISLCCLGEGVTQDYQIGTTSVPGNSYSWSSIPSGFTSSSPTVSVVPNQSIAYLLEVTQPNGCIARDTVVARFIPNTPTLELTTHYQLCDYQPFISANLASSGCEPSPEFSQIFGSADYSNVLWSFLPEGSTTFQFLGAGQTIQAPNADGIISAVLQFPECNTPDANGATNIFYRPGGHDFYAPNAFTPDGGQFNNVFRILEGGLNAPINIGDGPAYGISDFKLRLWNRWGENYKTITKADAGRAPNENVYQGDIHWDGTDQNGNLVQDGVYPYTLELQYCGQQNFERVCLNGSAQDFCLRWVWIFCVERLWGCSNHVTVIR